VLTTHTHLAPRVSTGRPSSLPPLSAAWHVRGWLNLLRMQLFRYSSKLKLVLYISSGGYTQGYYKVSTWQSKNLRGCYYGNEGLRVAVFFPSI
jgi:hypothetical protein